MPVTFRLHFDFFSRYYCHQCMCVRRYVPYMGRKVLIHYIHTKNDVHLNWLKWWRDHVAGLNVKKNVIRDIVSKAPMAMHSVSTIIMWLLCVNVYVYVTIRRRRKKMSEAYSINLHISTVQNITSNDVKDIKYNSYSSK